MTLHEYLNFLDAVTLSAALKRCCGASRWVEGMLLQRPFTSDEAVFQAADAVWGRMQQADILEAFSHHPRIGASMSALREKFASTATWSANEQAAVNAANEEVLQALAQGNLDYEAKFGHIFIVCATGKSASEMLQLLQARLPNDPGPELQLAAAEQAKITRIRLEKLSQEVQSMKSPITTHVLDTARGKPAEGVPITLSIREADGPFRELASGVTNADGRLSSGLLPPGALQAAIYQMRFDTGAYFKAQNTAGFYPEAVITFEITAPAEHYHIPLLLSPYGYSTYRGS